MKKRCKHCGYLNTDSKHRVVQLGDGSIIDMTTRSIRCYRIDAPDIELCPECKGVL